jgi:hypothetical protein
MKDIMFKSNYEPGALEIYAAHSTTYPDRLVLLGKLSKSDLDNIRQTCETQFNYCHLVAHPFANTHVVFFESEEDATFAKMGIGGDYQFKEFDK